MAPEKRNGDRKKRKAYYRKCAAATKRQKMSDSSDPTQPAHSIPKCLESGMTGYLITCNQRERLAMLESFRLLNDALSRTSSSNNGTSQESGTPTSGQSIPIQSEQSAQINTGSDEDESGDILSELRRENEESQNLSGSTPGARFSFYSLRSGVSNCLFLLHLSESASAGDIVHSIFQHLLATKQSQSRHVLRLLPVAATCPANCPDIKQCISKLWSIFLGLESATDRASAVSDVNQDNAEAGELETKNLSSSDLGSSLHRSCLKVPPQRAKEQTLKGPKTFLVMFKARNYNLLSRDDAIETTVSAVRSVDSSWRISPSTPSVIIYVNVLRTIACISLLEDFDLYRKYNVSELLTEKSSATPLSSA